MSSKAKSQSFQFTTEKIHVHQSVLWSSRVVHIFKERTLPWIKTHQKTQCIVVCRPGEAGQVRGVEYWWAEWAIAYRGFGRSVNPISTRGGRLCPSAPVSMSTFGRHLNPITTGPADRLRPPYTDVNQVFKATGAPDAHPALVRFLRPCNSYRDIRNWLYCQLLLKSKFEFWNLNKTNIAKF